MGSGEDSRENDAEETGLVGQALSADGKASFVNAGYPSVWGVIKLFLVLTLLGSVLTELVGLFVRAQYQFFTDGLIEIGVLLLILRYVQRRHSFPAQMRYPHRRLTVFQMLSIFTMSISLPFLVHFIDAAFEAVAPTPDWVNDIMISALNLDTAFSSKVGFAGLLFYGALTAAVVEEVFDRGLVLNSFIHRYGYWRAILYSSLFFAIMHLNPWQAVTALVGGVIMAVVVLRTHSLFGAVWIHMANNVVGFSMVYWMVSNDSAGIDALNWSTTPWPLYWNLLAAPVFLVGGYMFLKFTSDGRDEYRKSREAYQRCATAGSGRPAEADPAPGFRSVSQ